MATMVKDNDWLDEESGNLAREGLRTLVFAQKPLTHADLAEFQDLLVTNDII
jgi:phospholipid-translocating ATPase